jgi:uncharacterized protein YkwD
MIAKKDMVEIWKDAAKKDIQTIHKLKGNKMKDTMIRLGLATLAAVTIVGCGSSGGGSSNGYTAHPFDAPAISEAKKAEYLNAVNQARSVGRSCGSLGFFGAVPALSWDNALYLAAYEHTQDMATTGHFEHDGSGKASDWTAQVQNLGRGSEAGERTENNKASMGGENIAAYSTNLSTIIAAWIGSPNHCQNIMDKDITKIGMAEVGSYWTQSFGY